MKNEYPINYHILAEDFRGKDQVFTQEQARWLLESLNTMCNAYDEMCEDYDKLLKDELG